MTEQPSDSRHIYVAVKYPNREMANDAYQTLRRNRPAGVEKVVAVYRDRNGVVRVQPSNLMAIPFFIIGLGIIGLIIGLFARRIIAGSVVGIILGAIIGYMRQHFQTVDKPIQSLGDALRPNQAALCLLVDEAIWPTIRYEAVPYATDANTTVLKFGLTRQPPQVDAGEAGYLPPIAGEQEQELAQDVEPFDVEFEPDEFEPEEPQQTAQPQFSQDELSTDEIISDEPGTDELVADEVVWDDEPFVEEAFEGEEPEFEVDLDTFFVEPVREESRDPELSDPESIDTELLETESVDTEQPDAKPETTPSESKAVAAAVEDEDAATTEVVAQPAEDTPKTGKSQGRKKQSTKAEQPAPETTPPAPEQTDAVAEVEATPAADDAQPAEAETPDSSTDTPEEAQEPEATSAEQTEPEQAEAQPSLSIPSPYAAAYGGQTGEAEADIKTDIEMDTEVDDANAEESVPETDNAKTVQPDEEPLADFSKMKWVGPVTAKLLQDANIRTFAQLAVADPENIAEIIGWSIDRVERTELVSQAAALAKTQK